VGSRFSHLTIPPYLTAFPERLYELNEPNELHELNRPNELKELELSAFSAESACALHADKLCSEGFCFIKGERLQQPHQAE